MRHYEQQSEPGECINCNGHGRVSVETYYGLGDEDPDDCEECGVCGGKGKFAAKDIEDLGWSVPMS